MRISSQKSVIIIFVFMIQLCGMFSCVAPEQEEHFNPRENLLLATIEAGQHDVIPLEQSDVLLALSDDPKNVAGDNVWIYYYQPEHPQLGRPLSGNYRMVYLSLLVKEEAPLDFWSKDTYVFVQDRVYVQFPSFYHEPIGDASLYYCEEAPLLHKPIINTHSKYTIEDGYAYEIRIPLLFDYWTNRIECADMWQTFRLIFIQPDTESPRYYSTQTYRCHLYEEKELDELQYCGGVVTLSTLD